MKFTFRCALCALLLITVSGAVNAVPLSLQSRLGGLAVYDPNSGLTWLADANANGAMNWSDANAWADSLTIGGFSDWRLPSTTQPDLSCSSQSGSIFDGFGCTGSEMGSLFYTALGGQAYTSITTTHNDNFDLFSNVQSSYYWSATEYAPYTPLAWIFNMDGGFQNRGYKIYSQISETKSFYAWAVRSGDDGASSAVPEPTALSLIGIGAVVLFAARSRGARATQRTYG